MLKNLFLAALLPVAAVIAQDVRELSTPVDSEVLTLATSTSITNKVNEGIGRAHV